MTRGGPLWLYETPLFGPPGLVPFEFPLYQWLVAGLAGSGLPITLDQSSRLIPLAALVGCVRPLRISLHQLGATPGTAATVVIVFLALPVHVFWGRAAMIETLALLFAMGFLAAIQLLVASRSFGWVFLATLLATAAALVKITTFFSFAVISGLIVATAIVANARSAEFRQAAALAIATAIPICIAMAALVFWLDASDAAKASSPLTAWLGSEQLSGWNYGTLSQRFSSEFWRGTVLMRIVPDILGLAAWWLPAVLVFSFFQGTGRAWLASTCCRSHSSCCRCWCSPTFITYIITTK